MIRRLAPVLLAALMLAGCDSPQLSDVKPVQGTVVKKRSWRPGKVPRRYGVVVSYQGYEKLFRDRQAYRDLKEGDPYNACLLTYVREKSKESFTELDRCPGQ